MKMFRNTILNLVIIFIMIFNFTSISTMALNYLTFDDGPSNGNTNKILDILEKNNIKATFFVVGNRISANKSIIKRAKNLNMAIYPHCNNHDYDKIYSSKNSYLKDLNCCKKNMINILGENCSDFRFVRLPGGATNKVCKKEVLNNIKNEIKSQNIMYIDWNVDSGDAVARNVSSNIIKNNMKNYSGIYNVEVVLMHDSGDKESTVDTLQSIINNYKNKNYKFKTLNNISKEEINILYGYFFSLNLLIIVSLALSSRSLFNGSRLTLPYLCDNASSNNLSASSGFFESKDPWK